MQQELWGTEQFFLAVVDIFHKKRLMQQELWWTEQFFLALADIFNKKD